MRRLSISVLAALLLVGLVAAPAAAERHPDNGNLPHNTWIFPAWSDPVVEVPTGEWITVYGGWFTETAEQRADFLASVEVVVERDGVPQDVVESTFEDFGGFVAMHSVLSEPGAAKKAQEWMMRITFIDDHWDGSDLYTKGTEFEDTVTVVWVPRGQFK